MGDVILAKALVGNDVAHQGCLPFSRAGSRSIQYAECSYHQPYSYDANTMVAIVDIRSFDTCFNFTRIRPSALAGMMCMADDARMRPHFFWLPYLYCPVLWSSRN